MKKTRPKLSVVVAFYNMRREAERTLYSLTSNYQLGVNQDDYEVIILDSNSTKPLDHNWVESIQNNFVYRYVESRWPTPCEAMNVGIRMAKADAVVCLIDGARILSPGVLSKMIQVNNLYDNAFIQTIALHIGDKLQNESVEEGYNQEFEDELIATVDWQNNGYLLFNVSCLAASSRGGFLNPISESNCFCGPKLKLLQLDGFDEDFKSPGGGIVNHDILNRILEDESIQPVMLFGEGTFHQFHGGVATNVPRAIHPWKIFFEEYRELRGKAYAPIVRQPIYFGCLHEYARRFVISDEKA
jgi:glycosyltransferase involved in cell wall biosynthesis